MRLLPAQTTIRCEHFGCVAPATHRNIIRVVYRDDRMRGSTMHNSPVCSAHRWPPSLIEVESFRRHFYDNRVVPIGQVSACCGAPVRKGECGQLRWAKRIRSRVFSCDCSICRVFGGDCSAVYAYDDADRIIREHTH